MRLMYARTNRGPIFASEIRGAAIDWSDSRRLVRDSDIPPDFYYKARMLEQGSQAMRRETLVLYSSQIDFMNS